MASPSRAGSGELLIELSRASREPLAHQLQRLLREAIRSGRLCGGDRLPPSRALAAQLGVSRGLVVKCYEQLQSEGYLVARVGAGSVVADGVAVDGSPTTPAPDTAPKLDVDFEYGVPDLELFPRQAWAWAMGEACRTATHAELGDESDGGCQALREVLAEYVRRVRSSAASAEAVIVVPGFRHGLNVVLSALVRRGVTAVGLEDPGPLGHDVIAGRWGLRAVPIDVDDEGLDVGQLDAADVGAVLITPAHQCPTGVVLSAARRQQLVEWARRVDGYVVEDDFDAEFRYDREPVGSVQGLAPDRVVTMSSVSKTLAPTMRLGWMVVPDVLRADVLEAKELLGRGAPGLDQLALAALLSSGRFDRHLHRVRQTYRRRRALITSIVEGSMPAVRIAGSAAGCHLVLVLPPGVDDGEVAARCAERGIGIAAVSRYRLRPAPPASAGGLLVGYGAVSESAIVRGLGIVAAVLTGS